MVINGKFSLKIVENPTYSEQENLHRKTKVAEKMFSGLTEKKSKYILDPNQ